MGPRIEAGNVVTQQDMVGRTDRSARFFSIPGRLSGSRITEKDKSEFCLQLSVMLQARVSLHKSLEVLAVQSPNRRLKSCIERLGKEIQKGNSLKHALALQTEVFDDLFVVTAEVGQESGRLAEVLTHLAHHMEKVSLLRRKVIQALTYPALVIGVAVFVVSFLLVFIVPMFGEMFKNFQIELPASTKFILGLSGTISAYGLYFLGIILVVLLLIRKSLGRKELRQQMERRFMKVPFIGDVLIKNHVARFCRTLGTLLEAQVSLIDALSVTQKIISNTDLREEIRGIIKHVKLGKAVADPLLKSKIFPPMVVQMIAVGEETSELDAMLLKVSDYYEKELDHKVETLSSVIEPVLILVLGMIVAAILVSMYLPMFDLVNVVGMGK